VAESDQLVERYCPSDVPSVAERRIASSRSRRRTLQRHLPLILTIGSLLAISLIGSGYYLATMAERVRDPLHAWFKPSGYVGQTAGILSFFLFVFMWLYPLRRRVRRLSRFGSLTRWLDIHIFAGLALPFVGAVHAGWRFNGLIGMGFLAMVLVSLSGIVGRYLYLHIPRSRAGLELSLDQVESRRREMLRRIADLTGLSHTDVESLLDTTRQPKSVRGLGATLVALLSGDLSRWRTARALRKRLNGLVVREERTHRAAVREVIRLARREIALAQQARLLEATQRVFRFWHVAHLPFAVSAFIAVAIHVVVVVSLGVTWLW